MAVGYYSRTSAVAAAAGIGRDGRRERKQLNPGGKGYSAFHSVGLDDNTIAAVAYADAAAVVAAGDEDADDGAYRLLPSSRTTPEAAAAACDAVAAVGGGDGDAHTGPRGFAEAEDGA